ncbi:3-phosphoshikimate 1-carboxyvinyltransferase [Patulibacter sp.]|uniref:3-phosphoshikimate 1-carboxyvinyltransferase n=1 Tax=Patulibacter sp. TaxID=1912859 RepID=UPI00271833C9|nr:3-phosphoshikimate 1-carboxyvinyltransferase [Patulibacter sp.]MDO9410662.1 3-phosphoshikimate 1-carboxyvinyltransferase [Patulibacter sp.]
MDVRFDPSGPLKGRLTPPADKSISHRAAMVGTMASEPVVVTNYLTGEDTLSTLQAMSTLGALVTREDTRVTLRGVGLRTPDAHGETIDVGNAGTLMRLLPGWLAGQDGRSFRFDGDASIRRRPVDRIAEPLRLMGANIEATDGRLPPFTVHGTQLHGITYELPVASAQVKSCVLLAGMLAHGETTVVEPVASRDHTERLLSRLGVPLWRDGDRITVGHVDELTVDDIHVPGDISSAAFPIVAGVLVKGSRLLVEGVNVNWTRVGILDVLERMGAVVLGERERRQDGIVPGEEPVADLDVAHGPLRGTTVEAEEVPLVIDELPLVALLGCFAEGETIVRGAEELKHKESDRIATVVDGLRGLGADIEATDDGFVVQGGTGIRGGTIEAHGDHRLAMLGAVAGLASREGVTVKGMEAAEVSYPGFADHVAHLQRRAGT